MDEKAFLAIVELRKVAILADFRLRIERWQALQTAALAFLGLGLAGLATGTLAHLAFLIVLGTGLLAVLVSVRQQNEARGDMHAELAEIEQHLARFKRGEDDG